MSGAHASETAFAEAEDALARAPRLLRHHRGYLACLHTRPELAEAEAKHWRLAHAQGLAETLGEFDAALMRAEAARHAFDRFYDALAREGNLLSALEEAARESGAGGAMADLGGLSGLFEQDGPSGDSLAALWRMFQQRPELAGALGAPVPPGSTRNAPPWWARLAALDAGSGGVFGRLAGHFLEHPADFHVWHRRNLVLARHAEVRPWTRWWHARMREHDRLRGAYPAYAAALMDDPEAAHAAEARWRARFGPAPPWPPAGAPPPERAPGPAESGRDSREKRPAPEVRAPRRPEKPGVPMPNMPRMPTRPGKPPKP